MPAKRAAPSLLENADYLWTMRDGGCHDAFAGRSAAQSGAGWQLTRFALSECCPVRPRDWRFARDGRGKPFIAAPFEYRNIRISISHTDGLVACLVSGQDMAGLDVEKIRSSDDLPFLAPQLLSISEQRSLATLSGEAWLRRFFEYWTLKEAYAKALGLGLAFDFASICFEIDAGDQVTARFGAALVDASAIWTFRRLALSPGWAGAVAVSGGASRTRRLVHVELTSDFLMRAASQVFC